MYVSREQVVWEHHIKTTGRDEEHVRRKFQLSFRRIVLRHHFSLLLEAQAQRNPEVPQIQDRLPC